MKFKLPDTLILLMLFIVLFCGLTWVIPAGEFDQTVKNGRSVVVPGSYQEVSSSPAGFSDLVLAPIKGFIDSAQIIVFVLMISGSFGILNATGAIAAGLRSVVVSGDSQSNKVWVIPVLTTLFSLAGATFGMSEEVLVFIMITLPVAHSLGYDSFIGVGVPFLGAGAGFAGAFLNPFTIGIAQGIAGLQPFSGWEYRIAIWLIFTSATILFLMRYASRLKEGKVEGYTPKRMKISVEDYTTFNRRHQIIIGLFILSLFVLVWGVSQWNWYINEISGLFVVLGLLSAMVARLSTKDAIAAFVESASDMVKVCLVIAMAKGIIIVATEGKIIDTLLHAMTRAVEGYPRVVSVELMLIMQSLLNFFLPSGSGQAALTMPIMAPLGDLIGISTQTTVLAFQFGDGISNMVIPTSAITMGVLTLADIPYQKWIKWVWPLISILFVLALLLLIPPVIYFNY